MHSRAFPDVVGTSKAIAISRLMSASDAAWALFAGKVRVDQGTANRQRVHMVLAALDQLLQFQHAGRPGCLKHGSGRVPGELILF